jgi:signal peptidase
MHRHVRAVLEVCAVIGIAAGIGFVGLRSWQPVRVGGLSMHPALHPGDVVLVRRSRQPSTGEIALLRADGHQPVLHRVTRVGADGSVRTRGDANEAEDREVSEPSAVVGTVEAVLPVGRALERWRGEADVGYHGVSIEQPEAMTEKTSAATPIDQGAAR